MARNRLDPKDLDPNLDQLQHLLDPNLALTSLLDPNLKLLQMEPQYQPRRQLLQL